MANEKISQLPIATSINSNDIVPIVQGGITKSVTTQILLNGVVGATGIMGKTGIQGGTGLQGIQGNTGIQGVTGVQGRGQSTIFVVQPSGVAGGNIYTSWASMYAVLTTVKGPRYIYFDDSISSPIVIPSGAYDMTGVTWNSALLGNGITPTITVSNGVTFTNLNTFNNVVVNFLNSALVESISTARSIAFYGTTINANGTSPIWEQTSFLADFNLANGSNLNGSGSAAVVTVDSFHLFLLNLGQVSALNAQAVIGDSTTTMVLTFPDATSTFTAQTGFLGVINQILQQKSALLTFSTTTPGNWAGGAPTLLNTALERMAALLKTLNSGNPIP